MKLGCAKLENECRSSKKLRKASNRYSGSCRRIYLVQSSPKMGAEGDYPGKRGKTAK